MRVLVVTTVHTPLDARIHNRQIRALVQAGATVTYVAPWRATGTSLRAAGPGVQPVDVRRSHGRHRLGALRAARRLIRQLGPSHDVVLLHDPELVVAVAGQLDSLPPVVLDVHEDLAASLPDRDYLPRVVRPLVGGLARWIESTAGTRLAGVLLAEESYRGRFPGDPPVVPNLPWLPSAASGGDRGAGGDVLSSADRHRIPDTVAGVRPRVVQIGRLSVGRGVRELLAVGEALAEAGATDPSVPELELIGAADAEVDALLRDAQRRGIVSWRGFLPNEQALGRLRGALAGLSLLHDLPNYHASLPTKVAEYLAHGVPAIVTPLPEAVALVERADAGVVVAFEDPAAATDAILALARDPARAVRLGERGRDYIRDHASWNAAAPDFVGHLAAVAGVALPPGGLERLRAGGEPPGVTGPPRKGERGSTGRADARIRTARADERRAAQPADRRSDAAGDTARLA